MALCRFEAKVISRSGGRSTIGAASYRSGKCATSAAAYRAGAELKDERTGVVYDYTRKRGVLGAEVMLPAGAPAWMADRGQLWNAVEKAEKRADAQLARDYILTLPHELDAGQRRASRAASFSSNSWTGAMSPTLPGTRRTARATTVITTRM